MVIAQQEAVEAGLDEEKTITRQRRPLSRNGLVWQRLRGMPRFWVGAIAFGLIWLALVIYSWSMVRGRRALRPA